MNAIIQASLGEAAFQCSGKEAIPTRPPDYQSPESCRCAGWAVYRLAGYTVTDLTDHEMARYVMYKMLGSLTIDKPLDAQCQRKGQDTTGNVVRMQNALTQEVLRRAKQNADEFLARLDNPRTRSAGSREK